MLVILDCDIVLDWVGGLERERCSRVHSNIDRRRMWHRIIILEYFRLYAIPSPALIGVNPSVTPSHGSQGVCTAA